MLSSDLHIAVFRNAHRNYIWNVYTETSVMESPESEGSLHPQPSLAANVVHMVKRRTRSSTLIYTTITITYSMSLSA